MPTRKLIKNLNDTLIIVFKDNIEHTMYYHILFQITFPWVELVSIVAQSFNAFCCKRICVPFYH